MFDDDHSSLGASESPARHVRTFASAAAAILVCGVLWPGEARAAGSGRSDLVRLSAPSATGAFGGRIVKNGGPCITDGSGYYCQPMINLDGVDPADVEVEVVQINPGEECDSWDRETNVGADCAFLVRYTYPERTLRTGARISPTPISFLYPGDDPRFPTGAVPEEALREEIARNFSVTLDGVGFTGDDFGVVSYTHPESGLILTQFDYTLKLDSPGRHTAVVHWDQVGDLGQCPDDAPSPIDFCSKAGTVELVFPLRIVRTSDEDERLVESASARASRRGRF